MDQRRDEGAAVLRSDLEASGLEVLTRERVDNDVARRESLRRAVRRAAAFLIAIGKTGLSAQQSEELLFVERARSVQGGSRVTICIVLLPGAQPETLPRLLLPYGVIDLRAGGKLQLKFQHQRRTSVYGQCLYCRRKSILCTYRACLCSKWRECYVLHLCECFFIFLYFVFIFPIF